MTDAPTSKNREDGVQRVHPGGFATVPAAFDGGPSELQDVLQLLYRPIEDQGGVGLGFSTDAIAVNLSQLDPDFIDSRMLAADCDLLKRVALAEERQLKQLVSELQSGTGAGVKAAKEIVEVLGLTESDARRAGGGLSLLVVVAAAIAIAQACAEAIDSNPASPKPTKAPKPG